MKKALATFFLLTAITVAVRADILADWTFEGTAITETTSSDYIYGPADSGIHAAGSSGGGHHAATNTAWSDNVGNGSSHAVGATRWGTGDYFQFSLSTVGYNSLTIAFDQTGSNTGPRDFELQYSTNGTTFSDFDSYSVTNVTWTSTGAPKTASNHSFDLSSITSLNNLGTVYFRLTDLSATNITGGTVATTGTSRVDNFIVNGVAIPEPSMLGLMGLGAAMLVGVRRFYRRNS